MKYTVRHWPTYILETDTFLCILLSDIWYTVRSAQALVKLGPPWDLRQAAGDWCSCEGGDQEDQFAASASSALSSAQGNKKKKNISYHLCNLAEAFCTAPCGGGTCCSREQCFWARAGACHLENMDSNSAGFLVHLCCVWIIGKWATNRKNSHEPERRI